MDLAKAMAEFLQMYGGWGIAVLCMVAVIYQYKDFKKVISAKDNLIADMNAKQQAYIQEVNNSHHKEIVAVVKECTGVLTAVNESLERCEARQTKDE